MLDEIEKLRQTQRRSLDFRNDVYDILQEMKYHTYSETTKSIIQLKQQIQSMREETKSEDIREQVKSQFDDMFGSVSTLPTPAAPTPRPRQRTSAAPLSPAAPTLTPTSTPTLSPISPPAARSSTPPPIPRPTLSAVPKPTPTASVPTPRPNDSLKPKGPLSLCPISPVSDETMNGITKIDRQLESKPRLPTNVASTPLTPYSRDDYYHEGSRQSQCINLKIVIPIIGVVAIMFMVVLAFSGFLAPQPSADLTTTEPAPQVTPTMMNDDFSYIFEDEENEIEMYVYGNWRESNTLGPTNDCSFEVVRFQNSALGGLKPTNLFICTEGLSDEEISIEDIFLTRQNSIRDISTPSSEGITNDIIRTSQPGSAYEIRWTNGTLRSVELGTIVDDDKLYTLTYNSDPKSFEDNCNVAKKMVDSFKITSLDESHPLGTLFCNY